MKHAGTDLPVVVVGAGPTGLTAAVELSRMGVDVRIVDKAPEMSTTSRALGVQARTIELLRPRGVGDEMLRLGNRARRTALHADGRRLAGIEFGRMASEFNFILMLAQSETERLLAEQLGRQGIKVERGVEFVSLVEHSDSVEVTLAGPDGITEVVEASYVIAADGSHSPVRKALGLPFTGRSLPQNYVLGDLRLDGDDRRGSTVDLPGAQRVSSPSSRWATEVPVHGHRPRRRDRRLRRTDAGGHPGPLRPHRRSPRSAPRPEVELALPDQQPPHGPTAAGPGVLRRRLRARAQSRGRAGDERRHPGHGQPVVEARDGAATARRSPNCSTPTSRTGCRSSVHWSR